MTMPETDGRRIADDATDINDNTEQTWTPH